MHEADADLHGDGALDNGLQLAEHSSCPAVVGPYTTSVDDASAEALVCGEAVLADDLQCAGGLDGANLQHSAT